VQGLTEFLPVSSSGHLVIFQHLLGFAEPLLLLDVMLHLGTLVAVFIVFRQDLIAITRALFRGLTDSREPADNEALRLFFLAAVATVPTGCIGLLLKDRIESFFASPFFAAGGLLVTGVLLQTSRLASGTAKDVNRTTIRDALLIGICQGIAILPGVSRSGTTITVALLAGLERGLAARFSFLLAIPAILGASLLELLDVSSVAPENWLPILAGTLASVIIGYVSLKILIRLVVAGNFAVFAWYCWAAGLVTLGALWYG